MSVSFEDLLERTNELYTKNLVEAGRINGTVIPRQIQQESLKAALEAVTEAFAKTNDRIDELWRRLDSDYGDE